MFVRIKHKHGEVSINRNSLNGFDVKGNRLRIWHNGAIFADSYKFDSHEAACAWRDCLEGGYLNPQVLRNSQIASAKFMAENAAKSSRPNDPPPNLGKFPNGG